MHRPSPRGRRGDRRGDDLVLPRPGARAQRAAGPRGARRWAGSARASLAGAAAAAPAAAAATSRAHASIHLLTPQSTSTFSTPPSTQILRGEKRIDPGTGEGSYAYFLHFVGWPKSHDAWWDERELLRYEADLLTGGTSAGADELRAAAAARVAEKQRAARLAEVPAALRLRMPPLLKKVALDDFKAVVGAGRALPLPRPAHGRPSAAEALREWRGAREAAEAAAARAAAGGEGPAADAAAAAAAELLDAVVAGLLSYFDNGLRQLLLYAPEVPAADAALAGGAPPSAVYGAEHLVRLLVKLPELVPVVMMVGGGDARHVLAAEEHLNDLMASMAAPARQAQLFSAPGEYEPNPAWAPPVHAVLAAAAKLPGWFAAAPAAEEAAGGGGGAAPAAEGAADAPTAMVS